MTDDNINSPERCAERARDPDWRRLQVEKNAAAYERFAAWRQEIGAPLIPKEPGERF